MMGEEEVANLSLMNILAVAVLMSENYLELPIDLILKNFSDKNLSLSFNEDKRTVILELVESGETDESGQTIEEPA